MSKKARGKPAKAGSASVSPYGSVLGYELVTSQPNRLINLIWPECRTWFIGPCVCSRLCVINGFRVKSRTDFRPVYFCQTFFRLLIFVSLF